MSTITAKDDTQIYYKDWGSGQPVVFSHGWPLSADAFEDQMFFLALRGYRCIAHDRRGHDDQIVPIGVSAMRSSKLIKNATLKVYKGAPHGMCTTHKQQVNGDLLGFIKA